MSDIDQEILAEIRKLRRTNQWTSVVAVTILLGLVGYLMWLRPGKSEWSEITGAMRQSD